MIRKIRRFLWIGLPLLFLLAACSSASDIPPTTTPLDPAMFPPPGTPLGPNSHTPVVTPLSDGAAIAPGTAPVTTLPRTGVPATLVATQASAGGSGGVIVPPTMQTVAAPGVATGPATQCPQPAGWVVYTVQTGDTLSGLAQRSSVTTDKLIAANCLTDANLLEVGQTLYLPPNVATAAP